MCSKERKLKVIFLPYMAPGHMTPMVDIARLFASQDNIESAIIATPSNASRFQNTILRDVNSGRQISFLTLSLPVKEVGLPEGCENLIAAPTRDSTFKLLRAIDNLQPDLESLLLQHSPDCIVSDALYPWTVQICHKLRIPRLVFGGSGFFSSCVRHCLEEYRPHDEVATEDEQFQIRNLPDEISMRRSELQDFVKRETSFNALFERLKNADKNSFGVIINTFYELEPSYADFFRNQMGYDKSWHIGPLSLINTTLDDKVERGGSNCNINPRSYLDWLDSKEPLSVLYICFGSLTRFTKSQTIEMAKTLENLEFSFIWVLGKVNRTDEVECIEAKEWWLPKNFEEDVKKKGKGMIIRGWAPQLLILEHRAIGGFMTHCGWNSILEGVCAGVPLITWPIFAEQFYNEKLVSQVIKVGVSVGNVVWKAWATEESELVERRKIESAISRVMGVGNEREEIRSRAKDFSQLARNAIKQGGSSYNHIKVLIEQVRQYKQN